MNKTSTPNPDLAQRMQAKMTERISKAVNMLDQQLKELETSSMQRINAAENSISSACSRLSETARIGRYRCWLAPLIVGLCLTLGLTLGSATGISVLTSMIAERVQTLQQTEQAIRNLSTGGIDIQRYQGSLYLITQPGAPRPGVYPHQQYPDRWVVRIEEE